MLFPLLQKPMLFADSHVDICFLSTPKTGYPYQIDPQLLTSNRANWYLRPLNLDKILPTSCKLSNPLFPHHNDVSRMVPAPDNERQQPRVLAVISPYVTLVCCQLSRRDAISLMATRKACRTPAEQWYRRSICIKNSSHVPQLSQTGNNRCNGQYYHHYP